MATVDVTIRGAGIFGLSAAWACLKAGARVRVIDPGGVAAGASGGLLGALAPHAPDAWNQMKTLQLESLVMAGAFWREIEGTSGISPGYARIGRLQPLADERAVDRARARAVAARARWGGTAEWRVTPARGGDWCPISASGWLVEDTLAARLQPARACESLAAAIRARGGDIAQDGPEAGMVIHATGWQGLRDLSEALDLPVGSGIKGQALLLSHTAPADARQVYVDGLYIVPHADGTVAVGSTSERAFDDPFGTDGQLDALHERAVETLPILHGARVVRRWAGVRPRAETRAPILGAWPGRTGHFVLNGGFRIGLGLAPKLGQLAARLILNGEDHRPDVIRLEALF